MHNQTMYSNYENLLEFMYLKHENTDLYLEHCGMQHCPNGHLYFKPRSEYHVHFILNGCGTLWYHNKIYHLKRGDIFVIPPRTEYTYQADKTNPWYYAWVGFNGTKARQYLNQSGIDSDHIVRLAYIEPEQFTNLIYQILSASQLTVANELNRLGYLYDIMALLIETNKSDLTNKNYDYSSEIHVDQALKFIEYNYQRNININDVVEYLGVNRSYFSCIFKQKMLLSPIRYLQNFRIQKAQSLLKESSMNLQEIAVNVGYKDAFTFSKMYKKVSGISPSVYRNNL